MRIHCCLWGTIRNTRELLRHNLLSTKSLTDRQFALTAPFVSFVFLTRSSKGTLARGEYAEETVKMAKANKDFVFGFISQRCMVPEDPSFVYLTPGVQLAAGGDSLGQQVWRPIMVAMVFGTSDLDGTMARPTYRKRVDLVWNEGSDQPLCIAPQLQYNTPETVIKDKHCDVIIVGRGIYKADDPVTAAKSYQQAGWGAYMARLGPHL